MLSDPNYRNPGFLDWLRDMIHEDPAGFEDRAGEGWEVSHWFRNYIEEGNEL